MISSKLITAKFSDYLMLIKFRLTALVVFTALFGYLLAASGNFSWIHFLSAIIGTFFIVASANGFNQIMEIDPDSKMKRTKNRPLPAGRMNLKEAIILSILSFITGVILLTLMVNLLAAAIAVSAFLIYLLAYTPLKKIHPICTYIGAIPGALPPVIGWVAVRNEIDIIALLLFTIQFMWQFPHFWSIALLCEKDYDRAGFKMLPFSDKGLNSFQTALFSILLLMVSLTPAVFGFVGSIAALTALICGTLLVFQSIDLFRKGNNIAARRLMFGAEIYLPVLFIIMIFDKV